MTWGCRPSLDGPAVPGPGARDAEAFWPELCGEVLHRAPRPPGMTGLHLPARAVGWLTRSDEGGAPVLSIGLPGGPPRPGALPKPRAERVLAPGANATSHCVACGARTHVDRGPTALVALRRGRTGRSGTVSVRVGCRRRGASWATEEHLTWTDGGPLSG